MPNLARAEDYRARFEEDHQGKIAGLKWEQDQDTQNPEIRVQTTPQSNPSLSVQLNGNFSGQGTLIFQENAVTPDQNGNFSIEVPVKSPRQTFSFIFISPAGELTEQHNTISVSQWESIVHPPKITRPKKFTWVPGIGVAFISYRQDPFAAFSETNLTFTFQAQYHLSNRWHLGLNSYFSGPTLLASSPSESASFLGSNLRLSYDIPLLKNPWKFSIAVGLFCMTMFPSGNFGYSTYFLPHIYPSLRRQIGSNYSVGFYMKYVPMSQSLLPNLAEHELATGLSLERTSRKGFLPNIISIDFSDMRFDTGNSTVKMDTLAIGAAYSL